MNALRTKVEEFYRKIWNDHDKSAIHALVNDDFSFRGSLGQAKRGHDGFAEYVDMVHKALGNYKCTIVDLVVEEPKAFARMEFSGIHSGRFMGYEPTGKIVSWAGCALFTFKNNKVLDLWVLGDLKA
ncbi:MAG: ester cyclase, partial [Pseudanabaena sp.]